MQIRIAFYNREHQITDIVEQTLTTVPGKQPAWIRTIQNLLRFAARSHNEDDIENIQIEFLRE